MFWSLTAMGMEMSAQQSAGLSRAMWAEELQSFIVAVIHNVEVHDWKALLAQCDPAHYAEQHRRVKMNKGIYLAEIIGLHCEGNDFPPSQSRNAFKNLEMIRDLTVESMREGENGNIMVSGDIEFSNGWERLKFQLLIRRDERAGRFMLCGAVG